jgi:predicted amidohydrolase
MNPHLRVTLVQAELAWEDPAANRRALARHFAGLAGHTDLIVLPEMFGTGFTMNAAAQAEDMRGPSVDWMREEAAALSCVVTGSLVIRDGDRHFNRLLWVRPDGEVMHYDKRHLFRMIGEHEHYSAGDRRLECSLKGWRIRPFICYDLRFPVWSRSAGDCDLLIYVANWPSRRHQAWSTLLRARAIENQCYVVGVNRTGRDGNGASYLGGSVAIDFLGEPVSSEGDGDGVETAILDMASLQAFRAGFPVHLDADEFELV